MKKKIQKAKEQGKTIWQKFRRLISPIDFIIEAFTNFGKHDGMVMAGHLAFLGLLAIFPFIIFLITLAGFFGQTEAGTDALKTLFEYMPPDIAGILRGPIESTVTGAGKGIMTFSILGAIWVSSSAIDAARLAITRSYSTVTHRGFLRRRTEGIFLVILSASSIIIGMIMIVLGPVAWNILMEYLPENMNFTEIKSLQSTWNYVRLLGSAGLVFGALCLAFYVLKPRALIVRPPIMAGAFTTLMLWGLIGNLFSIYLNSFSNYSSTYGSLAGPIIALVFFYFLSASFILGAEINAALYHNRVRKRQVFKA
jgi:membrane protein